jgi:hypothetical protein
MGAILGILGLAGTAVSAAGQYKSGQDAKDVYEYNQQLAKYQSNYIQEAADLEVAGLERDVKRFMGRQRAIAGKSGTVPDQGSNLHVLLQTRKEADLDAAIIRYKADIGSWSADSQASMLGTQASQFNTASYLNAGTTLLAGASKWDWKKSQLKTYNPPPDTSGSRRK